jgi:hypothetical protein
MVRVHHEDPEHRAHLPPWRIHERTRTGDLHRFRTETMKTTTTLLDEVLPKFVVNVFSGWL